MDKDLTGVCSPRRGPVDPTPNIMFRQLPCTCPFFTSFFSNLTDMLKCRLVLQVAACRLVAVPRTPIMLVHSFVSVVLKRALMMFFLEESYLTQILPGLKPAPDTDCAVSTKLFSLLVSSITDKVLLLCSSQQVSFHQV